MNEEMVEMIVLLNGNFVPLLMKKSDMGKNEEFLMNAIKDGKENPYFFFKLHGATIFTKNIVGWYFRPKMEAPSDKMIKFLEKKLDDGGDSWKKDE